MTDASATGVTSGSVTQTSAVCRACGATGLSLVVDLGPQPPAERFIDVTALAEADVRLPLRIMVCPMCWLVQLEGDPVPPDDEPGGLAFSVSPTMREHVREYVRDVLDRSGWHGGQNVVEVASHGNRLHEGFLSAGAQSTLLEAVPHFAEAAREAGVPTVEDRLTPALADRLVEAGRAADLFVDGFYLAHDPLPAEYLSGVARLLAPGGVAAFEFDHLLPVILERQYDGFRHGHASYLSLVRVHAGCLRAHGLRATRTPFRLTRMEALCASSQHIRHIHRRRRVRRADALREEAAGLTGLAAFEASLSASRRRALVCGCSSTIGGTTGSQWPGTARHREETRCSIRRVSVRPT